MPVAVDVAAAVAVAVDFDPPLLVTWPEDDAAREVVTAPGVRGLAKPADRRPVCADADSVPEPASSDDADEEPAPDDACPVSADATPCPAARALNSQIASAMPPYPPNFTAVRALSRERVGAREGLGAAGTNSGLTG
ncbi:hypothetical protein [Mycolicibacterium sphagni]|uniref:Uncharacterized protein n=1 Tax=Mycolicibacterium sphagni TaxID=1786 RepID=A0ABX2K4V9_9MYCO|nr:hypothetical protein [Mycolicibacterium sphagni]NTY63149.1 hypothetical protein [Mycolicibacterium sphagni]